MTVNRSHSKKFTKPYSSYHDKSKNYSLLAVGFLLMFGTVFIDTSAQEIEQRYYGEWLITCSVERNDVLCTIATQGTGADLYLSRFGESKDLELFLLIKDDIAKLIGDEGILRFHLDNLKVVRLLPIVGFFRYNSPPRLTVSDVDELFFLLDFFESGKNVRVTWQKSSWPMEVPLGEYSLNGFKSAFIAMRNRDSAGAYWKSQRYGPALSKAAASGNFEEVLRLIDLNADPNYHNPIWQTPLHEASSKGHYKIAQILIRAGAKIEATDILTGRRPLHEAAFNGRIDIVKLLLEAGAQIDAKNSFNQTPLFEAAENGKIDVVRVLINRGASKQTRDKNGKTPEMVSREKGHIDIAELLKVKNP